MTKRYSVKIVENEFGQSLNQTLGLSLAIMNIHFQQGVYAEWPRILLAYVNGKILLSEDLGHPLVTGKHYCALGCDLDEVDLIEIHGIFGFILLKNKIYQIFLNRKIYGKLNYRLLRFGF
jgi:hypothetical protein